MIMIMPNLEMKTVSDRIDMNGPIRKTGDAAHTEALRTEIAVYNCPTHPGTSNRLTQDYDGFAKGTYAGSTGSGRQLRTDDFSNAMTRGVFAPVRQNGASFADIIDGTSNVIFVGEIVKHSRDDDDRGAWGWVSGSHFSGQGNCTDDRDHFFTPNSRDWDCTAYSANDTSNSVTNWRSDPDRSGGTGDQAGMGARSFHPGGVQFCMGDGKVTFISENVDRQTYFRLLSIMDGEPVTVP